MSCNSQINPSEAYFGWCSQPSKWGSLYCQPNKSSSVTKWYGHVSSVKLVPFTNYLPSGNHPLNIENPFFSSMLLSFKICIHKMGDAPASLVRQVVEFHSPVSDLAALIIIKSCEIRRKSPSFIANQRSITIKIGNQSVWQLSPM